MIHTLNSHILLSTRNIQILSERSSKFPRMHYKRSKFPRIEVFLRRRNETKPPWENCKSHK